MLFPSKISGSTIQMIASVLGSLLSFNYGLVFGTTSSHILLYQSPDTPLHRVITTDEASWISSWLCIGAFVGSILFGYLSDKIGPKTVLLICGLLQIGSWFCIHFGYDIMHIHWSRMLAGAATGGIFTALPLYITEISEVSNRGSLAASVGILRNIGILSGFIIGSFVPHKYVGIIGGSMAFLFSMLFPFVEESPYHYLRSNNLTAMEKSLRWFRGIRHLNDRAKPEFLQELEQFKESLKSSSVSDIKLSKIYVMRVILISLMLMTGAQLCGIIAVLNYADSIFKDLDTGLESYWSAIILGAMQLFGGFLTVLLADKINRKILICLTSFICGIALALLALFIAYGELWKIDINLLRWIPLVLLSLHITVANIGLYPLTFVVIAEIAPKQIKGKISSIALGYCYFLNFWVVKYYYLMIETIGLAGCMWIFSSACLATFLLTLFIVPETRGRSFDQIQNVLGGAPKTTQNVIQT